MASLTALRSQITDLRETKGREADTLALIDQAVAEAESEQSWEDLFQLYLEKHLTYRHLIMNQRLLDHPDQNVIDENLKLMAESTLAAQKVFEDHHLDRLAGTLHQFLGRMYAYQNQYPRAIPEYRQALDFYQSQNSPRTLEVSGLLAESLIRSGQVDEGTALALKTYADFDTLPSALNLKNSDYYTWAVWRSGIIPRLATAFNELHLDYDRAKIKNYLLESLEFLIPPDQYCYRVDEIKKILGSF